MKKQRTHFPKTQGVFSPNKVAASAALRLNCDSMNLGPNVDMPAMSVASVAPARQSRMNVGFFRRSQMELLHGEGNGDQAALLFSLFLGTGLTVGLGDVFIG